MKGFECIVKTLTSESTNIGQSGIRLAFQFAQNLQPNLSSMEILDNTISTLVTNFIISIRAKTASTQRPCPAGNLIPLLGKISMLPCKPRWLSVCLFKLVFKRACSVSQLSKRPASNRFLRHHSGEPTATL